MKELPETEEMHAVTGSTCVILKVRVESTKALEGYLARVYSVANVSSTETFIVLSSLVERVIQAQITSGLVNLSDERDKL